VKENADRGWRSAECKIRRRIFFSIDSYFAIHNLGTSAILFSTFDFYFPSPPFRVPQSAFRIFFSPSFIDTPGGWRFMNHDLAQPGAFGRKPLPKPGRH
jgi:hypothetical protein